MDTSLMDTKSAWAVNHGESVAVTNLPKYRVTVDSEGLSQPVYKLNGPRKSWHLIPNLTKREDGSVLYFCIPTDQIGMPCTVAGYRWYQRKGDGTWRAYA